jgi:acyl-CoA reductase-like NAD-dependent aldehyde dehydrogenase
MADASIPYGLTASVFSSSPSIARAVLEQLDVGMTYWNAAGEMPVAVPW